MDPRSRETLLKGLETRLENLEPRLETLETRLETLETRLETLETRLESREASRGSPPHGLQEIRNCTLDAGALRNSSPTLAQTIFLNSVGGVVS